MVVDYSSRKNEVLDSYNKLEEIVEELQDYSNDIDLPNPAERLEALMADIRGKAERVKDDRFNIIIAGESKSGKSTFINAYLGVELLPMDVKQCTSSIVEIKYGERFSIRATHAGGIVEEISGDDKAREFLKQNAALDDDYRDIPVPTINSEILVKSGQRAKAQGRKISISKAEVEAMLKSPEVIAADIHIHNTEKYNKKIRTYIEARKDYWEDIVTKIEVMFPFGNSLKGIEIIDSPGVCTRGGVSEITSDYIENADAIIFLKPVIGQALESEQFNHFMENVSVARNKNALFLVLTHIAAKNDADIRRLEEEAYKIFSGKLSKDNILFVDSKAEIYAKKFQGVENVVDELRKLNNEGNLDDFVAKAYTETNGIFGDGDVDDFVKRLHEKSRFDSIYNAMELFGRKAHYILLASLLDSISKMYNKLWNDVDYRVKILEQKAEDPTELARKIALVKQELDVLQNKLSKGVDKVVRQFRGDDGVIRLTANEAVNSFRSTVGKIDPNSDLAFNDLEGAALQKIDYFKEITETIQHQVVGEFDKELIALSKKDTIPFESLKPDFTEDTFRKIKEDTKTKATETEKYSEGWTFKETKTRSVYVQNKHFRLIKDNIIGRLDILKNDLTSNLEDFVENIRTKYIDELSKNANSKKDELDKIQEAKITAEQTRAIIQKLSLLTEKISDARSQVIQIKGGIDKYV